MCIIIKYLCFWVLRRFGCTPTALIRQVTDRSSDHYSIQSRQPLSISRNSSDQFWLSNIHSPVTRRFSVCVYSSYHTPVSWYSIYPLGSRTLTSTLLAGSRTASTYRSRVSHNVQGTCTFFIHISDCVRHRRFMLNNGTFAS